MRARDRRGAILEKEAIREGYYTTSVTYSSLPSITLLFLARSTLTTTSTTTLTTTSTTTTLI
jgi:hypothetical protein